MVGGVSKVDTPSDFNTFLTQCYLFFIFSGKDLEVSIILPIFAGVNG
jgi:hypothetical protein